MNAHVSRLNTAGSDAKMVLPAAVPRIGTMPMRNRPSSSTLLVPSTSCALTGAARLQGVSNIGREWRFARLSCT